MVKNVRQKKYYAPQNENIEHQCDFPGCDKKGEYRAPKNRGLKEYYWFCLEHVQAYNAQWNYYSDQTQDEAEREQAEKEQAKRKMHFSRGFRSKVKYQFGYDFNEELGEFGKYTEEAFEPSDIYFNEKERGYLRIMELHADNISVELIKKQYKKLVKKYHPDLHREDKKEAEEKFKQLTIAYQGLMAKFS